MERSKKLGDDSYIINEFGNDKILFIWEFTEDYNIKRKVEIKYYALDEILGLVGGNLSLVLAFFVYIVGPYS